MLLGGPVKVKESMWTLSDGEININLQKMYKAEMWECALRGRGGAAVDAFSREEVRRKLMLERFQEEVRNCAIRALDDNILTLLNDDSTLDLIFQVLISMVRFQMRGRSWVE
jgi:hypothetical protein